MDALGASGYAQDAVPPAHEAVATRGDGEGQRRGDRVVVVTSEGLAVTGGEAEGQTHPAMLVEQPAKVMRIGSMIKQLLEEVRAAPLDEASRARLAEIHERSLAELEKGLAPELVEELRTIALPFDDATTPSTAELRIAQAQLVGWLEGLFHGIQTALFAQQMAARSQLEQMRRALPAAGSGLPGTPSADPTRGEGSPRPDARDGTGQYL